MKTTLLEIINAKGLVLEVAAATIFLTGLILHFSEIENSKYFIIVGGSMLILLYIVKFYLPDWLEDSHSLLDVFIYKAIHGALAIIILGVVLSLIWQIGPPLIEIGLVIIMLNLAYMAYNRFWVKSKYIWGPIYYFRIIYIAGLGIYLIW